MALQERVSSERKFDMWYDNLSEKTLWENFTAISSIPRESGNEEGIRTFLLDWAKERGIKTDTDKIGNVYYYVPATEGMENVPCVCLQGHMDMVCVKTRESKHDFTKDPIEIVYDGGYVRAKDTSLGADNGIAVAMAMTIITDESAKHGPIECLFTVSEETGMDGAFAFDTTKLSARKLVNIDSEEEGIIYTGCAGGIEIDVTKRAAREAVYKDAEFFTLSISGLLGGHSGGEIHKGRLNAIKAISRVMHRAPDFMICDIKGGTKRNVIPSEAHISFCVKAEEAETLISVVNQVEQELKIEYAITDPDLVLTLTKEKSGPKEAVKAKCSHDIIEAIYLTPCNVQGMSAAIPGVVETSNNVAIASLDDKEFKLINSSRSLIESAKLETAYRVAAAAEAFGFKIKISGSYPGWAPDPNSKLEKALENAYRDFYNGKEPIVTCIHAGLECGVINARLEGMDSVSIGPNLWDVHSINEKLEAESAERTLGFIKYFLEKID